MGWCSGRCLRRPWFTHGISTGHIGTRCPVNLTPVKFRKATATLWNTEDTFLSFVSADAAIALIQTQLLQCMICFPYTISQSAVTTNWTRRRGGGRVISALEVEPSSGANQRAPFSFSVFTRTAGLSRKKCNHRPSSSLSCSPSALFSGL